ncbi:MAG: signal recognition particle-docking protein FtsY, partial [Oscillospiraceae bacterium]|nr:signal recognition particle-docking protein FtsY [Oscillospiraceae bacterium]
MGLFDKFKAGLKKTRDSLANTISSLQGYGKIDDDLYDEIEESLIMADIGVETTMQIIDTLKEKILRDRVNDASQIRKYLKETMLEMMEGEQGLTLQTKPVVILIIGVNGVGKTTTIGKLAHYLNGQGKKVLLGAADTFRAAAIDQLQVWGDRVGVDVIAHQEGAVPAAVVFDTIAAGKARGADVIICDTAGRLHNKKNLMDELNKIYRVVEREAAGCQMESWLVLDATTGQNGVNQARQFMQVCNINGIVLTKLDGTAKGGVVLAIKNALGIDVKFVGVGEQA